MSNKKVIFLLLKENIQKLELYRRKSTNSWPDRRTCFGDGKFGSNIQFKRNFS
jgi:hypothetical protein